MVVSFKGAHFPKEIILTGVRWYLAYPLSTRHVEEMNPPRSKLRGIRGKITSCETPRFLTLFPLQGNP